MLDQDVQFMADLTTYSWLVSLAEAALDKEEEAKKLIEQQRQGR